jgi:hypothetical protein
MTRSGFQPGPPRWPSTSYILFTHQENSFRIHYIWEYVGPRACLDAVESNTKSSSGPACGLLLRTFFFTLQGHHPLSILPLSFSRSDFFFSTAPRPIMRPSQPFVQWVPVALSPGVKRQGHEADYLPLSSVEVKKGGAILPLPIMSSWYIA